MLMGLLAAGVWGGFGGPGVWVFLLQREGLLSRLEGAGYGEVDPWALGWGGGGFAQMGRVRVGGWGVGASAEDSGPRGGYTASWGGGGFVAGYDLVQTKGLSVGADIVVGGWGEELYLAKENSSQVPEDSLLADPGLGASLGRGGFSLGLQLRADCWVSGPFGLELVAGGMGFLAGRWETPDGVEVAGDEPTVGIRPYLGVYLLFGGTKKED